MRTKSAKAKGRRCSEEARALLLEHAPELQDADVIVTSSGVIGEDLVLSPVARLRYPLSIECKNTEALNVWKALAQAESRADESVQRIPILFFKRNRSKLYVALSAEDFVRHFQK